MAAEFSPEIIDCPKFIPAVRYSDICLGWRPWTGHIHLFFHDNFSSCDGAFPAAKSAPTEVKGTAMAFIDLFRNGAHGARINLKRSETRIGRGDRCDIVLPDEYVSRVHLVVRQDRNRYELIDRSRNGTFVNGTKRDRVVLTSGDRIDIGDWSLVLVHEECDGSEATVRRHLVAAETVLGYEVSEQTLTVLEPVIEILDGEHSGHCFAIGQTPMRIGRDRALEIVLADPGIEALHAEVAAVSGGIEVRSYGPSDLSDQRIVVPVGAQFTLAGIPIAVANKPASKRVEPQKGNSFEGMVGSSKAMRTLFGLLKRLAHQDVPVLVLGETGTGKELVGRALHTASHRAEHPFVAINCGAIAENLVESELFGHVKGAFTGASSDKEGAFRAADGGTLFLDEIGELDLNLQTRLLRVLETGEVTPVGSQKVARPKVRIVAATHRDLASEVAAGNFRADLFYRLFVVPVRLPPLRERKEDIPDLVRHFLDMFAPGETLSIDDDALSALVENPWEGNVRALQNTLLRAVAVRTTQRLKKSDLEFPPSTQDKSSSNLRWPTTAVAMCPEEEGLTRVDRAMRRVLIEALEECNGAKRKAAPLLGIARSTLYERIDQYNISLDTGR